MLHGSLHPSERHSSDSVDVEFPVEECVGSDRVESSGEGEENSE